MMLNILPVAAEAAAANPDTAGSMGNSLYTTLLMIGLIVAIFYFMAIRPENKKKKAANEMRNSLKVGDEITTIGGIVGTVCAVKEQTIVLETGADRVRIEFTKWAISSKGTQSDENSASTEESKEKKKKKHDEDR